MRMRAKYALIAVLVGGLALAFFGFSRVLSNAQERFAAEVSRCNRKEKELRFSCYQKALAAYSTADLRVLRESIEKNRYLNFEGADVSYAIFGTNCHTFYHAVGDTVAKRGAGGSTKELVDYCSAACTSGCVMGLYKRLALAYDFSDEIMASLFPGCPEGSSHQCAHEIGHLLHDTHTYSILKILDETAAQSFGLSPDRPYTYTVAEEVDLNAPFEECKKFVPEEELVYCYTGIGHNMFLFYEFAKTSPAEFLKECDKADASHRNDCQDFFVYRVGINEAATLFMSNDFEGGHRVCKEYAEAAGRMEVKTHCYRGLGGGIGLFIDSEYSHTEITEQNLAPIQKRILALFDLCKESEAGYAEECFKGILGTGAKKLYKKLNIGHLIIEKILPTIESDFEVVG